MAAAIFVAERFVSRGAPRRSAMRTAERVKVVEWIAAFAAVAFVALLVVALLR